jgi:hypothetical protein
MPLMPKYSAVVSGPWSAGKKSCAALGAANGWSAVKVAEYLL